MKIVFFGTPSFVVPILERLHKEHDIVAVVTAPDKKVGRKQLITPSPVKQYAQKNKIPVLHPKITQGTWEIEPIEADLFIVAAYGKIIPQHILDIPTYGALNVHPSLLPRYRGPSPIQQTLRNGDKSTGVTIIKMDAQMDHGPIVLQESFPVNENDTFETMAHRLFAASAEMLAHIIPDYVSGKITPVMQQEEQATYTKIITKDDGFIDLDNPPSPKELDQMIRAYYPWPGVWSTVRIKNQEVRIKFLPNNLSLQGMSETSDVAISSKFLIQLEGKKPVSMKEFLRGYPELTERLIPIFRYS